MTIVVILSKWVYLLSHCEDEGALKKCIVSPHSNLLSLMNALIKTNAVAANMAELRLI